jgi:hypothetical protein
MLARALLALCLMLPLAARAEAGPTYLAFATGAGLVKENLSQDWRGKQATLWRLELGQVRSPTHSLGLSASFTSGGQRQPDVTDLALALRVYPRAGAAFVRASLGVSSVGVVRYHEVPVPLYEVSTYRGPSAGLGLGLQLGGKDGLAIKGELEVVGRLLAARDSGAWLVPERNWAVSACAWLGVEWY